MDRPWKWTHTKINNDSASGSVISPTRYRYRCQPPASRKPLECIVWCIITAINKLIIFWLWKQLEATKCLTMMSWNDIKFHLTMDKCQPCLFQGTQKLNLKGNFMFSELFKLFTTHAYRYCILAIWSAETELGAFNLFTTDAYKYSILPNWHAETELNLTRHCSVMPTQASPVQHHKTRLIPKVGSP
jgi:hypothetical protein